MKLTLILLCAVLLVVSTCHGLEAKRSLLSNRKGTLTFGKKLRKKIKRSVQKIFNKNKRKKRTPSPTPTPTPSPTPTLSPSQIADCEAECRTTLARKAKGDCTDVLGHCITMCSEDVGSRSGIFFAPSVGNGFLIHERPGDIVFCHYKPLKCLSPWTLPERGRRRLLQNGECRS